LPSDELKDLPPGERRQFGRYTLLHRFASGGMADIFLGRLVGSDGFQKIVAIKLVRRDLGANPEFIKMLVDEARLVSRISHPNVVNVYELGRVEGTHFIAMEYVEGESVGSLLRRVRPPLTYVARVVADAAAGLHAAHELRGRDGQLFNVIHRDVSPGNILISYQGATKVSDFGIARARGRLQETNAGMFKGKFSYTAPEVILEKPVDRRADVFSLGIVLYEMATRKRLFKAKNPAETVRRVLSGSIAPPSTLLPDFPKPLEEIILHCLKREPASRFQTAQELQLGLERFIHDNGGPVLPSDIGQMMSSVFADRIQQKHNLLEQCSELGGEEPVQDVEVLTSASFSSRLSTFTPRRRLMLGAIASAVVAVAALVLVLVTWGEDRSVARKPASPADQGAPRATPDARVARTPDSSARDQLTWINIVVSVSPASAALTLDGKPVDNPLVLRQPAAEGEAALVARARGYTSQTVQVPLGRGGTWRIKLQRAAAPAGPGQKARPKGLDTKSVLDNPY